MTEPAGDAITAHDERQHYRCPLLGGPVPFAHCRTTGEGMPCRRTVECWQTMFDVERFLDAHYDRAELQAAWNTPPKAKAVTLAELVRRARGQT